MKIVLIGASQDHLETLQELEDFWGEHEHCWVTSAHDVAVEVLPSAIQCVYWVRPESCRPWAKWFNFQWLGNLSLAWQVLHQERPQMVIVTSAATIAVPFLLLAKTQGCHTAVVESLRQAKPIQGMTQTVLPWLCNQTLWVW